MREEGNSKKSLLILTCHASWPSTELAWQAKRTASSTLLTWSTREQPRLVSSLRLYPCGVMMGKEISCKSLPSAAAFPPPIAAMWHTHAHTYTRACAHARTHKHTNTHRLSHLQRKLTSRSRLPATDWKEMGPRNLVCIQSFQDRDLRVCMRGRKVEQVLTISRDW